MEQSTHRLLPSLTLCLYVFMCVSASFRVEAVDCTDPTPSNGSTSAPAGFADGEYAYITCDNGYEIQGEAFVKCLNGTWSDNTECIKINCTDPTPVSGLASTSDFTYGSEVNISCDPGYTLSGSASITCQADGTWSEMPTCDASDCGSPAPTNGFASTTLGTTFGSTATLSCDSGYNLSGHITVECESSGTWNGSATCTIQDCGDPSPTNGTADIPKGTTYGEVAIISCSTGFILQGSTFITCDDGGIWSASPTCQIRDCGDPTPVSGLASTSDFTYGSEVNISCDPGYTLSGSASITCQADGTWSEMPTCDASDCGSPVPTNGFASTTSGTTFGSTATLSCDSGYNFSGDMTVVCESSGTWNGSATCIIQDCGDPSPAHGSAYTPKGTTYGNLAVLSCVYGYHLIGSSYIKCEEGGMWSGQATCILNDDSVTETSNNEDIKSQLADTSVAFGLLIGLLVLIDVIAVGACVYKYRCKKKSDSHEPIDEEDFDSGEIGRRRLDYDDDTEYPEVLLDHPPPSSRQALPPLQFMQRENVNIVPPLTKKPFPFPTEDTNGKHDAKIQNKTSAPTPRSQPSDKYFIKSENGKFLVTGGEPKFKKDNMKTKNEPPVKKAMAELPTASLDGLVLTNENTNLNTVKKKSEVQVKSVSGATSSNHGKQVTKKTNTITTLPREKSMKQSALLKPKGNDQNGDQVVNQTTTKAPVANEKEEREATTTYQENTSESNQISVNDEKKQNTGKNEELKVEAKKGDMSNTKETNNGEKQMSNDNLNPTKTNRAQLKIPFIDVNRFSLEKGAGLQSPPPIATAPILSEKSSSGTPKQTESHPKNRETKENKNKNPPPKLTLENSFEKRDINIDFISERQPDKNNGKNEAKHIENQDSFLTINETETTKHLSTDRNERSASISSTASQVIPSVENIPLVDDSTAVSDKTPSSDTRNDTLQDATYSDFSSDSELELSSPSNDKKAFVFDAEQAYLKMPNERLKTTFFADDTIDKSKLSNKTAHRPGKSAATLRTEASSRLLSSSYGSRSGDSVKVYNPALDAAKGLDAKTIELRKKEKEQLRAELERKRQSRLTSIRGVYTKKLQKSTKRK